MGDSDEEYDRRRGRDKFRRERSDYQERGGREERTRGRDDWVDRGRDSWPSRDRNRRDYRGDYDVRRRDRYSPQRHDMSPPMKKMRGRDNWEDRGNYSNYDMGYGGSQQMGHRQNWGGGRGDREEVSRDRGGGGGGGGRDSGYDNMGPGGHQQHGFGGMRELDIGPTQPPMMTFKQFLASQDDSIGDEEAVRKYNEYKLEFKKQQLNEFFLSHKEEEWFKSKYHPEECCKKRNEQLVSIRRRVETFMDLLEKRKLETVSIDIEKADDIIKFLDSVVIKLEGGSEIDLNLLDAPLAELEKLEKQEKQEKADLQQSIMKEEKAKKEKPEIKEPPQIEDIPDSSERPPEGPKSEPEDRANQEDEKKRKRSKQYNFEEKEEENISESESDLESAKDVSEAAPKEKSTSHLKREGEDEDEKVDEVPDEKPAKEKEKEKEVAAEDESSMDEDRAAEDEEEDGVNGEPDKMEVEPAKIVADDGTKESEDDKADVTLQKSEETPKARLLHRTCSIFLRNLAPSITKQEVEAMCRRYPGFLRVAIADPQPERRFFRRGWVTFERSVNIKEICWNLNSSRVKLRDCELGASVNRDLTRRIRACSGIAAHKQIVKADIKMAARVIQHLDGRHELWAEVKEKADSSIPSFGLISRNPLLKNITDYLIEEASAEEEELLGLSNADENKSKEDGGVTTLERDEALIKVLDRLLMYLRIVHSVDYYNHSDYPNEDEMPNRCGIMHARGSPPLNRVTQNEINEHIASFELKIAPFLQPVVKMAPEEAIKLGEKDPESEVEKFILVNTQELAKDKWLCPLSGKKFKGPEFVRKHIFNKHGEKIEEVKKEVEYFNNYLRDAKRPQLPEHPGNRPPPSAHGREGFGLQGGFQPALLPPPPQHYGFGGYNQQPRGAPAQAMFQGFDRGGGVDRGGHGESSFRSRGNFFGGQKRGGRARGDPREIVGYQDLDAPDDLDLF